MLYRFAPSTLQQVPRLGLLGPGEYDLNLSADDVAYVNGIIPGIGGRPALAVVPDASAQVASPKVKAKAEA